MNRPGGLAMCAGHPYKNAVEPIRYFNRHTGSLETEAVYG